LIVSGHGNPGLERNAMEGDVSPDPTGAPRSEGQRLAFDDGGRRKRKAGDK
jgi:hypothetical protein